MLQNTTFNKSLTRRVLNADSADTVMQGYLDCDLFFDFLSRTKTEGAETWSSQSCQQHQQQPCFIR